MPLNSPGCAPLTEPQQIARLKVYGARKEARGVVLMDTDVMHLWESILQDGRELRDPEGSFARGIGFLKAEGKTEQEIVDRFIDCMIQAFPDMPGGD